MRSTSLEICCTRSEIAQPCCGSSARIFRMSRSSVPCGKSMRSWPMSSPLSLLQGRVYPCSCRSARVNFIQLEYALRGGLNVSALGAVDQMVGGAVGKRLNGASRLIAAAGHQVAAVYNKKIGHIVGAMEFIHHGGFGIVAHAAGAEQMDRSFSRLDRPWPFLNGSSSLQKLHGAVLHEMGILQIIGMVLVGHPQRGQSPGVFHIRIQSDGVRGDRQAGGMRLNKHGPGKIISQRLLKSATPLGSVGRLAPQGVANQVEIEPRVHPASAVKASFR